MTKLTEGRGIVDRIVLDGMDISIEVEAGGTRSGVNFKGERWENTVKAAYGYILGTNSPDGEHLDVWVKKNAKDGRPVFVIHQLTPDGSKYDEDKVMLGYSSQEEAIKAFKDHAFKPEKMFGGCSEFNIEHFKVIAYQASNSSAMLASQKMFDKFVEKGLLPKGVKSPIQISQIVKEGVDMALHISYKSNLVAESAFELALSNGITVKKSNTDVIFESESQLSAFIKLVDESQEDSAHLGDLYEVLPEDFQQITESNMGDAIDDLKSELRTEMSGQQVHELVHSIAKDYGVDQSGLMRAFENATKSSVFAWAAYRDALRAVEQNKKQQADKAAADAKAEKASAAAAKRKANSPQMKMNELVNYVIQRIGDYFPDGDPTDALLDGLESMGIDRYDYAQKYQRYFEKQFKAATGYDSPYDYAAGLWDDVAADNPDEYGDRNPYRESVDLMLKLAGVKSAVMETRGTPTVHAVKADVVSLTEAHNTALRKYMTNYAVKKQRALTESVSEVDMDAALRRYANTILTYPKASADAVLRAVAEKAVRGDERALREHIGATTGLTIEAFKEAIEQRAWKDNRISRQMFESLMEATEAGWNLDCPDKGTAFAKACR
ncbi:hypothetical protein D3C87_482760 [compost metagenome]